MYFWSLNAKMNQTKAFDEESWDIKASVSSVVEFPGEGLSRLRTINSELNGATQPSEAATEAGRASVNFTT